MARYDIAPAWYRSPRGRTALVYNREGTNDVNTSIASMIEDEYGLAELSLTGHAIDIGGYLGTVALGLLLDNPSLEVTIVEPLADNIAIIRKNLAANDVVDRATILQAAAGFPSGETQIIHHNFRGSETTEHHKYVGNISLVMGIGPLSCNDIYPHDHTEVPVVSISDLARDDTVFLKIDCEGGEWAALQDRRVDSIPVIRGEIHPVDGHKMAEIHDLLPLHDVKREGEYADSGPCEFRAVLR